MKKQIKRRDPGTGVFAMAFGGLALILAILSTNDLWQRLKLVAPGLMLLSWGSRYFAAAKKQEKQALDGKPHAISAEDRLESERLEKLEKIGSTHNVLVLLVWIFLFVAVVSIIGVGYLFLFHRH